MHLAFQEFGWPWVGYKYQIKWALALVYFAHSGWAKWHEPLMPSGIPSTFLMSATTARESSLDSLYAKPNIWCSD